MAEEFAPDPDPLYQRPRPLSGWWLYSLTRFRFPRLHNLIYWRGDRG